MVTTLIISTSCAVVSWGLYYLLDQFTTRVFYWGAEKKNGLTIAMRYTAVFSTGVSIVLAGIVGAIKLIEGVI